MSQGNPPITKAFEVDQSRTAERAADVFQRMKKMFSDPLYEKRARKLSVRWLTSDRFVACAGPSDDGESDIIAASYPVPLRLNEDAVYLAGICEQQFSTDYYREIFDQLDYGDGHSALPADLTVDRAADMIFRLALGWLYLHEQAHLFQNHALIAPSDISIRMLIGGAEANVINDFDSHSSRKDLRGAAAASSHVLELSADAEAIGRIFELCYAIDNRTFHKSTLWVLICALSCMFQRFFGRRPLEISDEPVGSHPNPAFRMRIAIRILRNIVMHPKVQPTIPWLTSVNQFDRVVEHATTTASMFWTMYTGDQGREKIPDFYEGLFIPTLTPEPYRQSLFDAWNRLKNPIEESYWGWATELDFDPLSPDAFE